MNTTRELLEKLAASGLSDYRIADLLTERGHLIRASTVNRLRHGVIADAKYALGKAIEGLVLDYASSDASQHRTRDAHKSAYKLAS